MTFRFSPEAQGQYLRLVVHYESLERSEAISNLNTAVKNAIREITRMPRAGLPAPRPYPDLAGLGQLWVKSGPYWFSYHHIVGQPGRSAVITGIFYDRSDIPGAV